jgi:hypothetical protein
MKSLSIYRSIMKQSPAIREIKAGKRPIRQRNPRLHRERLNPDRQSSRANRDRINRPDAMVCARRMYRASNATISRTSVHTKL